MMMNNRNGSIMIASFLVVAVLIVLMLAYSFRVVTEYGLTSGSYKNAAAAALAEAGVERGIWELNHGNGSWSGWTSAIVSGNLTKSITVPSFQAMFADDTNVTVGDYAVTVTIPAAADVIVEGTGFVPNQASAVKKKVVNVKMQNFLFSESLFSNNDLSITGNSLTDSYDSSAGPYSESTRTNEGNIGSNGDITLTGSVDIYGNATPGPGKTINGGDPLGPSITVTGSTLPAASDMSLDPIPATVMSNAQANNLNSTIPAADFDPPGSYNLSLGGNDTLDLAAGTYYFTSISIGGNAKINISSGPVNIYVDGGNIVSKGDGILNSGKPTDLFIYSSGNSMTFSGNFSINGGIYAPNATIDITGNTTVYGSLMSKGYSSTGSTEIHRDTALSKGNLPFSSYRVKSWQNN